MSIAANQVSVVIPTYRRGRVLLETLGHVLALAPPAGEVIVVDQTDNHPQAVLDGLAALERSGRIRCVRFSPPSIPRAMNAGLRAAKGLVVLFLDDDVVPAADLVAAHAARHEASWAAVTGQVLQPGEVPAAETRGRVASGLRADLDFSFRSTEPVEVRNVMAGNLSVSRETALSIGGFDERFAGTAYRFETDFARRLVAAGHRILFAPEASLRHLRLQEGGTRDAGDHLSRPSPRHAVGDYYFAYRHGGRGERVAYIVRRLFQESINRYYLRHPWRLPMKGWSELRAWAWARRLNRQGPCFSPDSSS